MHCKYELSQSFNFYLKDTMNCQNPELLFVVLNHITSDIRSRKKNSCVKSSASSKMAPLYWIAFYIGLFKGKTVIVCVCVPDPVPTCPCTHLCPFERTVQTVYVCFYAHVGVWMSVCVSLCCHICCYQGNPVGRRRSAERCTAWRRETCGAQPVAGKKPVRDSLTNPVPSVCPWDELFLTGSDS